MSEETGSEQHLAFADAEINAAASIVNAMIAESEWDGDDWIVDLYGRLLDVTAKAKTRLRHDLYHLPLDGGETEL